jgi:Ca-activated chloride channel family protein
MKRKFSLCLHTIAVALTILAIGCFLASQALAGDSTIAASGTASTQLAQASQLQNVQPGYVPPPSTQGQGSSSQTLTLPQVAPQQAQPPASLEIPGSKAQSGTAEVVPQVSLGHQAGVGRISVTATDDSGHWIQDLRAQDLAVYEDGIQRQVLGVQHDNDTPITIGFVVDTSGSMNWKLAATEAALEHFVRTLNPRDQFFLIAFSDKAFLLQDFTSNPSNIIHAISLLHAFGNTALFDAVVQGLRKVEQGRWPKKALLVLTDGMDNSSSYSLNEVIQAARRAGVLIYTVGLGTTAAAPAMSIPLFGHGIISFGAGPMNPMAELDQVDAPTLRTLSDETGATTFIMNPHTVNMSRLDAHFQRISAELREQYTVSYVSTGGPGTHQIRVEGTRPGTEVRAPKWTGDAG